jgi:predicted phage terminase large subunit-like protein
MVYDDVVTKDSVTSPEMIAKVTESVSLSFNLGSMLGNTRWFVGTRYHMADTYADLIKRGSVVPRIYAATKDGTFDGEPWFWSRAALAKKIKDQGTYVASCQLFNNPVMEGEQTFREEWLQYWRPTPEASAAMNVYLVVDPANSKTKKSDYTVILVIGLGPDQNYYLIDGLRDKLTVRERSQRVMALHAMHRPRAVGYEKYGIQTDIDFLEEIQAQQQYRFRVTPLGGNMSKIDRIKRLQPLFESNRVYLPEKMIRVDYQGKAYDLTQSFLQDEYLQFPYMTHDDMLDCMARITDDDLQAHFPNSAPVDWKTGQAMDSSEDEVYDYDTYAYN